MPSPAIAPSADRVRCAAARATGAATVSCRACVCSVANDEATCTIVRALCAELVQGGACRLHPKCASATPRAGRRRGAQRLPGQLFPTSRRHGKLRRLSASRAIARPRLRGDRRPPLSLRPSFLLSAAPQGPQLPRKAGSRHVIGKIDWCNVQLSERAESMNRGNLEYFVQRGDQRRHQTGACCSVHALGGTMSPTGIQPRVDLTADSFPT